MSRAGLWLATLAQPGIFVFRQTITASQGPYDLKAAAIAAGWDQLAPLDAIVTVNSGVAVGALNTGQYAFTTGSGFPATSSLALNNAGFITGVGGVGGRGAGYNASALGTAGGGGAGGGPALLASAPISINNTGTIGGGGGGGGGSANHVIISGKSPIFYSGGGGGGGRASIAANAAGRPPGELGTSPANPGVSGGAGGAGTYSAAGGGGGNGWGSGTGGAGGGWGAAGGTGAGRPSASASPAQDRGPYGGGAGGVAVVGNSNITWVNTGTRLGAIT